MVKRLGTEILNFFSVFACLFITCVLVFEISFHLTEVNRELFAKIHRYIFYYFSIDVFLRIWFVKKSPRYILTHFLDMALIIPLLGLFFRDIPFFSSILTIQIVLLIVLVGRVRYVVHLFNILKFNPAQLFLMGFGFTILIGSLLLSLPISLKGQTEISFVDSVFTATSAVCVTGLIVQDTGTFFSAFGQSVILVLVQIGGLGIMAFSALLALFLQRKMSSTESVELQESYASSGLKETFSMMKFIFSFTLLFEAIGAIVLFFYWYPQTGNLYQTLFYSVFHSVSAFCNAGFSLFSDSLIGEALSFPVIGIISLLIILGGLGFPVIYNLRYHAYKIHGIRRLRLQTKLTVLLTFILIVVGTLIIWIGEAGHALVGMTFWEQGLTSFFQSVTTRTAGFNTIELGSLRTATLWIMLILMFIGASPGSTGGGIKTTTFGLLVAAFWNTIRSRKQIEMMGRTIPYHFVFKAVAIIIISSIIVITFFYLLLLTESGGFFPILFETISAFGTVGLSVGMTEQLTKVGKILIILLMFIGRVGPLSIAFALARRRSKPNYAYPEERILLG
ncbi:MAG: hypothetical protein HRT90_01050 [Candidatus Margulisbacteria bacterium]|nr:hypothetical protein [Candidatus Margulisiibacteriota bacterium]